MLVLKLLINSITSQVDKQLMWFTDQTKCTRGARTAASRIGWGSDAHLRTTQQKHELLLAVSAIARLTLASGTDYGDHDTVQRFLNNSVIVVMGGDDPASCSVTG